ncbi:MULTISPECIES: branched-chain amino acid ABC transporter permease [Comamonas]|uniref:Branched-chain amino acid ABC transporter permease n=1 Tax=Comamonas avium TaxID=2762231 RepID=A0ABR8S771_9BURK|nr:MULTISPECIES: branched-chain amino acid ABC transporter permease [Comamonas]MBD7959315.1 branched-chain amino acid ABC transporter permease [Comamonas avium]
MDAVFLFEQALNGLGYGLMLFLLAAGLTLVFGIMDTLNLAHGSMFMAGGYISASVHTQTGSFTLAVAVGIVATVALAAVLEAVLVRKLYVRDHLSQVLATFGVVLVADDVAKYLWGPSPIMAPTPSALSGAVQLFGFLPYPSYRLLILAAGLGAALALYALVNHTRLGMWVRAGASNRAMAQWMGIRVNRVFAVVFAVGAALAALAGALLAPISAVQVGMGESILIPALVVIVIGGIGSIRGALVASLLVGLVDTAGRALLPPLLREVLSPSLAADIGPAVASISMYVLMAGVLVFKPSGLFPARA